MSGEGECFNLEIYDHFKDMGFDNAVSNKAASMFSSKSINRITDTIFFIKHFHLKKIGFSKEIVDRYSEEKRKRGEIFSIPLWEDFFEKMGFIEEKYEFAAKMSKLGLFEANKSFLSQYLMKKQGISEEDAFKILKSLEGSYLMVDHERHEIRKLKEILSKLFDDKKSHRYALFLFSDGYCDDDFEEEMHIPFEDLEQMYIPFEDYKFINEIFSKTSNNDTFNVTN